MHCIEGIVIDVAFWILNLPRKNSLWNCAAWKIESESFAAELSSYRTPSLIKP
jgi:hypothetical protein